MACFLAQVLAAQADAAARNDQQLAAVRGISRINQLIAGTVNRSRPARAVSSPVDGVHRAAVRIARRLVTRRFMVRQFEAARNQIKENSNALPGRK